MIADLFGGQINPYTGRPINTEAEYNLFRNMTQSENDRLQTEAIHNQLAAAGLSKDMLNQVVNEHPVVKQAAEAIEASRAAMEQARSVARKSALEDAIKDIAGLDPSIKTLDDLAKMPQADRFYQLVERGYTLKDAYVVANYDSLNGKRAAAARQAAVNQIAGKQHLTATQGQGKGGIDIPPDTFDLYKTLLPHATPEEIRQHYATHNKG